MSILGYIKDVFQRPAAYRKFWVAFATAVVNLLAILFTGAVWLPILVTFLGSVGVLGASNAPSTPNPVV